MLAVVVRTIGGPEVVEVAEVPRADPGPGQVRIKVAAAALNPADAAVWMGIWGPVEAGEHLGVGLDAAGTVDAVGLGVARAVGTPVIAFDATIRRPVKAQAEYLVVEDFAVAPAPAGMDPALAATIPLNAMTASQALDHLPLRPGDTLLVTGAAGAVGGYAVELARMSGRADHCPGTARGRGIAPGPGSHVVRAGPRRCGGGRAPVGAGRRGRRTRRRGAGRRRDGSCPRWRNLRERQA